MFTQITTHIQDALNRLISQYKGKPNISGLISVFVAEIQNIENALVDMNTLRYLPNATGHQLDNIGKIVGLPRPAGMSDANYILELLGQIKINISQGQPEQIIQVFLLFTQAPQVRLFELFPADVIIESDYMPPDQATINNILKILKTTGPAGVSVEGLIVYDPVKPFAYRLNVAPGVGYGTRSDPTVGGKYGTLKRAIYPFAYAGNSTLTRGYGTRLDPLIGGAYQG